MRKKYAIQLAYAVPSEEKDKANKCIMYIEHLNKILKICDNHLDLIYQPFKDNQNGTPEQTFAARAALRRYRDKVADNFNTVKRQAFKAYVLLQPFNTDTQIIKLTKSFVASVQDVEKQVNRFIDLFSDLEAKDFNQLVIKAIDNIKKEVAQLEQMIDDRIVPHIQNNILAKNWTDNLSEELQQKVEKNIPLSLKLVQERDEKINGKEKDK